MIEPKKANETVVANIELADGELDSVSGGETAVGPFTTVTQNSQKGVDKAAAAADQLIRG